MGDHRCAVLSVQDGSTHCLMRDAILCCKGSEGLSSLSGDPQLAHLF